MKVIVTGAAGQLGRDVVTEMIARGYDTVGITRTDMDITMQEEVMQTLLRLAPDAVIHCAAWTNVDAAEESSNLEAVYAVNVAGSVHVARACERIGCKLIYISTDYVFSGQGSQAWQVTDACKPLNTYGVTKFLGEQAALQYVSKLFIVRISWVFGMAGKNFVKTVLRLAENTDKINMVGNEVGTPTYTVDLAKLLAEMVKSQQYGVYHATNEGGYISWYEFANEIIKQARTLGLISKPEFELNETTSAAFARRAVRPLNSRMRKDALYAAGFHKMPPWNDALMRFLTAYQESQQIHNI